MISFADFVLMFEVFNHTMSVQKYAGYSYVWLFFWDPFIGCMFRMEEYKTDSLKLLKLPLAFCKVPAFQLAFFF